MMCRRSRPTGEASTIFPRRFAPVRRAARHRPTHSLGSLSLGSLSGEPLESLCRTLKMRAFRITAYFGRIALTEIPRRAYPVCERLILGNGTRSPGRGILDQIPYSLHFLCGTLCGLPRPHNYVPAYFIDMGIDSTLATHI